MFKKWRRKRQTEKLIALAMRQAKLEHMRGPLIQIIAGWTERGKPVLEQKIVLATLDQELGDLRSQIEALEAKLEVKAADLVAKLAAAL